MRLTVCSLIRINAQHMTVLATRELGGLMAQLDLKPLISVISRIFLGICLALGDLPADPGQPAGPLPDVAQIFNTKVTVEKYILERYESTTDMKDFNEYMTEFSEQTARLISDQHLVNIMFVEPVYEKRSKSFYTLGYINRAETARILMDRMKREQETMEYYVRMAQSLYDPVKIYQYYTEAQVTKLHKIWPGPFHSLEDAITDYVQTYLLADDPYLT